MNKDEYDQDDAIGKENALEGWPEVPKKNIELNVQFY